MHLPPQLKAYLLIALAGVIVQMTPVQLLIIYNILPIL